MCIRDRDIDDPEEVIKNKRKKLFQKEEIIIFFERLVFLAALVYIIFGVIFGITPMKNKDMSPKINAGDLMLFYRLENNFSIRDVVIFEKDGVSYTGRIIAKDGDTVEITNEAEVKVNGSLLAENDIYYFLQATKDVYKRQSPFKSNTSNSLSASYITGSVLPMYFANALTG